MAEQRGKKRRVPEGDDKEKEGGAHSPWKVPVTDIRLPRSAYETTLAILMLWRRGNTVLSIIPRDVWVYNILNTYIWNPPRVLSFYSDNFDLPEVEPNIVMWDVMIDIDVFNSAAIVWCPDRDSQVRWFSLNLDRRHRDKISTLRTHDESIYAGRMINVRNGRFAIVENFKLTTGFFDCDGFIHTLGAYHVEMQGRFWPDRWSKKTPKHAHMQVCSEDTVLTWNAGRRTCLDNIRRFSERSETRPLLGDRRTRFKEICGTQDCTYVVDRFNLFVADHQHEDQELSFRISPCMHRTFLHADERYIVLFNEYPREDLPPEMDFYTISEDRLTLTLKWRIVNPFHGVGWMTANVADKHLRTSAASRIIGENDPPLTMYSLQATLIDRRWIVVAFSTYVGPGLYTVWIYVYNIHTAKRLTTANIPYTQITQPTIAIRDRWVLVYHMRRRGSPPSGKRGLNVWKFM